MEWIWLIIIVVAVVLDLVTSDFLFSGFSIGAVVALFLDLFGVGIIVQIVVFGIVGAVFTFTMYPIIKKKLKKDNVRLNLMEENYIGEEFVLEKNVDDEILLKFQGTYWTFKAKQPIASGETVKIIAVEGNKLLIDKVN
ncbi:MAG: NfeD family protein [Sarcina sp.]